MRALGAGGGLREVGHVVGVRDDRDGSRGEHRRCRVGGDQVSRIGQDRRRLCRLPGHGHQAGARRTRVRGSAFVGRRTGRDRCRQHDHGADYDLLPPACRGERASRRAR